MLSYWYSGCVFPHAVFNRSSLTVRPPYDESVMPSELDFTTGCDAGRSARFRSELQMFTVSVLVKGETLQGRSLSPAKV